MEGEGREGGRGGRVGMEGEGREGGRGGRGSGGRERGEGGREGGKIFYTSNFSKLLS